MHFHSMSIDWNILYIINRLTIVQIGKALHDRQLNKRRLKVDFGPCQIPLTADASKQDNGIFIDNDLRF